MNSLSGIVSLVALLVMALAAQGAENERASNHIAKASSLRPLAEVLPAAKWKDVEGAVDRALAWIASQQSSDGSFPTYESGQPAVSSFSTMAFLSRGHEPGHGQYGERINRAIDFVLSCQQSN